MEGIIVKEIDYSKQNDSSLYQKLLEALIEGGLESIVKAAYDHLKHPIIITDSKYDILIEIPHELVGDYIWDSIFEANRVEREIIEIFSEERLIRDAFERDRPFVVDWGAFKDHPRLLSHIIIGEEIVGYIVVLYLNADYNPQDISDIELIKRVIAIELQRKKVDNYKISDLKALYLINILNGKIASKEEFDYLEINNILNLNGCYYVLAAQISRASMEYPLYHYIRNAIEGHFPELHVAVFNDYFYILISEISNQNNYNSKLDGILNFLISYNLKIGISYIFSNILDAHIYKAQADFALNYCLTNNELKFCSYRECVLNEILAVITKNMYKPSYMHPGLKILYDNEKDLDLYDTLYYYILSMKDVRKTLEKLHIHRNTLYYRLNKIEEITHINLSDSKTYAHLLLNFYIQKGNKEK